MKNYEDYLAEMSNEALLKDIDMITATLARLFDDLATVTKELRSRLAPTQPAPVQWSQRQLENLLAAVEKQAGGCSGDGCGVCASLAVEEDTTPQVITEAQPMVLTAPARSNYELACQSKGLAMDATYARLDMDADGTVSITYAFDTGAIVYQFVETYPVSSGPA